jgi:FkbM family methyltransferase
MESKNTLDNDFLKAYRKNIAICLDNDFHDNWDEFRFGPEKKIVPVRRSVLYEAKQLIKKLLSIVGLYQLQNPSEALLGGNVEHFQWIYERLVDDESRELMVQVLSFRALGNRKVKLPVNNAHFWEARENAKRLAANCETIDLGWNERKLYKMDLSSLGYDIKLFFVPNGVVCLFDLRHYEGKLYNKIIKAEEGDVVIDAGGCWGDSALYFAHEVGENGKVYSFEFMPDSLEIFERNMSLNPELSRIIKLVRNPLWSKSGEQLFVEGSGPGASVVPHSSDPSATRVETYTIDDLVSNEKLKRVDFIKMDIEGAELEALRGAESTIRQFRPKLAISLYHKLNDIWEIPQYIDSLGLGYKFALKHVTIHAEETILYAN